MKTKVKIILNSVECRHKKGAIGYIDGYLRAADNRGYAVVVVGETIDFVPLDALKAILKTPSENQRNF